MTGTGLSQLITILLMPILTRNYSPNDFGLYTIYLSIFLIVNTISTGKYERVIFLVNSKSEIQIASTLCLIISVLIAGVLPIIIYLIDSFRLFYIEINLYIWLYTIPILSLITATNLVIVTYLNKQKKYKIISTSRIIKTLTSLLLSLLFILFKNNLGGLILSEILGYLIATIYLFPKSKDLFQFNLKIIPNLVAFMKKYKQFPLFNIPSDFLNITSAQMPVFFLSMYYGSSITGFFSLMKRVLDAPINLLSSSILEVFRQKASEQYLENGNCRVLFLQTAKRLTLISFFPFVLLFVFAPYIFSKYLGNEWYMAGVYARIFSIYYFFKFVSSPLSYMFYLAEKQKIDFVLHIYIFTSTLIILNLPFFFKIADIHILSFYMINFSIIYIYYFIYSYNLTIKAVI